MEANMSGVGRSGQGSGDGIVTAPATSTRLTDPEHTEAVPSGTSPGRLPVDEGDGFERRAGPPAEGAESSVARKDEVAATALARAEHRHTTIFVHGIEMQVEYDPAWASKSDVAAVERGLNRYPPRWIRGAVAEGKKRGEDAPRIRMVSDDGMGVNNPPEGRYTPEDNVIYLNMEKFNDPQQRSFLKDAEGTHFSGQAWLERTAIHEFAHYLDDAGTKDTRQGFDEMATFVGPWKQRGPGLPPYRDMAPGKFRRGVIDRNATQQTPGAYVTEYDRRTNQGRSAMSTSEHETFAEIVTVSVLGGPDKREELLANPELKGLAEAVYQYLDRGADPDQLSN